MTALRFQTMGDIKNPRPPLRAKLCEAIHFVMPDSMPVPCSIIAGVCCCITLHSSYVCKSEIAMHAPFVAPHPPLYVLSSCQYFALPFVH